jgi:hypothetical protein
VPVTKYTVWFDIGWRRNIGSLSSKLADQMERVEGSRPVHGQLPINGSVIAEFPFPSNPSTDYEKDFRYSRPRFL